MFFLAILGIGLMIVENEIVFGSENVEKPWICWYLRLAMSFSTFLLLISIVVFHRLDLALFTMKNSLETWTLALTFRKLFFIFGEILICSIHPVPIGFSRKKDLNESSSHNDPIPLSFTDFDVALGLPSRKRTNEIEIQRVSFLFQCFFDFTCFVDF